MTAFVTGGQESAPKSPTFRSCHTYKLSTLKPTIMALGLSPKQVREISLEDLSSEQFLVIALKTAEKLGWNIGSINKSGFAAYTKISMASFSEEVNIQISNGTALLKSECTGNQLMDWGKNRENITKFIESFNLLKQSTTPEEVEQRYEELKKSFGSEEDDFINHRPISAKEKLTGIFSVFVPVRGYFITPLLIDLNIALFVMMALTGVNVLMPDAESLLKWGANFRPITLEGEWWRLLTSCFLHIGIFHLLMNMYALLYIGLLLEPYLGKAKFLTAYLLTGIAASASSLWWNDLTISAGASGAIFGMYGVFLALLTTDIIEKSARKSLLVSIGVFVLYNISNGLRSGGIDNAAHLGGLISGIIAGYAFVPGINKQDDFRLKAFTIAVLTVAVTIGAAFVYTNIRTYDLEAYDAKMQKFVAMESLALEMYALPSTASDERMLHEIKTVSLYYWNENKALLREADRLYLPEALHDKNKKIFQYCNLRIKTCNLICKSIEEKSDQSSQIREIDQQLEALIKELSME
jgi:rhomboid protease GluP